MSSAYPLILTAAFDPASAAVFQLLRDQHFPPRLNIVPAHLTLFHNLPGSDLGVIAAQIQAACLQQNPMPFAVGGLRFLGRGVAFVVEAPALDALRWSLAALWQPWLGAQDKQPFRPHVTVQNKADPAVAKALRDRLAAEAPSIAGTVVGLNLWHYRGGPWDIAGRFAFARTACNADGPVE